ncbi:calmodulin-binding protein 25-like [Curcuma longa]|uniref:calmodulin-binding protein 25-like n=1 Tax=Curcuma longa TaxID=136217 RepID=UPI003D9F5DC2
MMAEDCSVLDPWLYRSESAWMSEAFARDNEALTRALQISLAADTSSSGGATTPSAAAASPSPSSATSSSSSPFLLHRSRQLAPSAAPLQPRSHPLGPASGARVAKRRSRATKRSPTTYINADPANFREMVQRVTGIQVVGNQPPAPDALVKPEPIRAAPGSRAALQQLCLPTLDTSALLLANGVGSLGAPLELPDFDGDVAFSPAFPTLESWGIM